MSQVFFIVFFLSLFSSCALMCVVCPQNRSAEGSNTSEESNIYFFILRIDSTLCSSFADAINLMEQSEGYCEKI